MEGRSEQTEMNLTRFATLATAIGKFKSLIPPTETVKKTMFTILMANDVYEISPDYNGLGGLAELTTLINNEKSKPDVKNVIVTLNGDFLSASSLAVKYKGSHMVHIFNHMPLDYVVLGNHEFDFGADVLRERIKEGTNFKWFASNILDKDTGKVMNGCLEIDIKEFDGIKVGLFGVCTRATISLSKPGDSVIFLSVIETSKRLVKHLREEKGCDTIVAITHLSVFEDRELARLVPGIDVIIGGHDHSPHTQMQGSTFIHKAGHDSHWLTRIDLIIEKKKTKLNNRVFEKVKVFPAWNMILNRGITPDPKVKVIVDQYLSELPQDSIEEIGIMETALDSSTESVRSKESTMGNLICDILRDRFETDLVVINGGTIRGDRPYDAGHRISKGDIYKEFPFITKLQKGCILGKHFLAAIEQMISRAEYKPGCFPQLGPGISIEYDVEAKPLQRIKKATLNGETIDPSKTYTIASTDYLFGGGDGVSSLKNATNIIKDFSFDNNLASIVTCGIIDRNIVSATKEGRIYIGKKKKEKEKSLNEI